MKLKKLPIGLISIISLLALSAYSGNNDEQSLENNNTDTESYMSEQESEFDSHNITQL